MRFQNKIKVERTIQTTGRVCACLTRNEEKSHKNGYSEHTSQVGKLMCCPNGEKETHKSGYSEHTRQLGKLMC